jgi:septal ring factor EnvC (AmiA/AmiB activator)
MMRFVVRVLTPSRLRRALWSRLDARYVTKPDHRQDIKDTLWEVQMLRREVVALRGEIDRLRRAASAAPAQSARPAASDGRAAEAHRLATETAEALDTLLQSEMRIWQAIDDLSARVAAARPVG